MNPTVLVVGSYPPVPVPGAAATVAEVQRAWAAGDEVVVVAPRLSASHLTVAVHGLLAGRRLANVRRVTATDRLVIVVEDGYPLPSRPLPHQLASAAVLVRALRGFAYVRVVQVGGAGIHPFTSRLLRRAVDDYAAIPSGPGAAGVTPLGPAELRLRDRAAVLAGRGARRVLGHRAPAARRMAGRARRALHRTVGRDLSPS